MANNYLPPVITIPSALEISNISQSMQMVVTVSANSDQMNTYISGQLVRLNIPYDFGMFQANNLNGTILTIGDATLTLNIDSTGFDTFVIPSATASQPATVAPAGSRNLQYDNSTMKVPFQSLNNMGN